MLRSFWKNKIDKIQAGNNEITTTKLRFCLGPQLCLHYGHKCKINFLVSSISMWNIFFCNRWRTSQPFDKQPSSSLHRPSFNSLPTPCHSSYLSFGALALTVANNTAHIPSTPLFFKYLTIWTLEPQLCKPRLLFCPQNQVKYFTFWVSSKTWQTTILFFILLSFFLSLKLFSSMFVVV